MFNEESDEVLSLLPFSRGFQDNDLVFHAEVGCLLFFLLKRFPGIPKKKRGRYESEGGLTDVKRNSRQSLQSDHLFR